MRPAVAVGASQRNVRPVELFKATNFEGASTVATASVAVVSLLAEVVGVASIDACALGSALIDGAGADASSFSDPDFDHTITAKRIIPTTTALRTAFEVPCFGVTPSFAAMAGFGATGAGVVVTLTREDDALPPRGTGGTTIVDAPLFFAELFFTTFLADFFAVFFTADFFATLFLATAFLATLFLATRFLAVVFLATDFFATAFFLAGAFLEAFFTTLFVVDFFTATFTP